MDSSRTLPKFTHEYQSLMEMDRNSGTSLNVFEVSDFILLKSCHAHLHLADCHRVFLQCALKGDAPALEGDVSNLGMRDDGGASPLHYASSKGHIRVINLIVQIAGSQGQTRTHSRPITTSITDSAE